MGSTATYLNAPPLFSVSSAATFSSRAGTSWYSSGRLPLEMYAVSVAPSLARASTASIDWKSCETFLIALVMSYSRFRRRTFTELSSACTSIRSRKPSTSYALPYWISTWKYELTIDCSWRPEAASVSALIPYWSLISFSISSSFVGSMNRTTTFSPPRTSYSERKSRMRGTSGASSGCVFSEKYPVTTSGSSSPCSMFPVTSLMLYSPSAVRSARAPVTG